MRVVEVRLVEDCLDGSYIRELVFDEPLDRAMIESFVRLGELRYYGHFARPFFTLHSERGYKLKGIEGESTITAVLYDDAAGTLAHWLAQALSPT